MAWTEKWKSLHILPESSMQFFDNYPQRQQIAEQCLRKNPCYLHLHHDQGEFLSFHHDLKREMKIFRFFACIFFTTILLKLPFKAAKCKGDIYAILPLGRFTSAPRSISIFTVLSWPEQRNERVYTFWLNFWCNSFEITIRGCIMQRRKSGNMNEVHIRAMFNKNSLRFFMTWTEKWKRLHFLSEFLMQFFWNHLHQ